MEANVIELKNRGMHQDFAISKTSDEFAFENINIRITANDDRTLLAVTNEKGSSPIDINILPTTRRFNLVTFKAYYSKGLKWDIIFEHVTTKDVQVRLTRIALPNTKTYVITVPKGTDKYSVPSSIIIDEFSSLSNNLKISIEGDRTDINYVYRTQDEINTDPTIGEDKIIAEDGDNKIEGIYLGKAILNNYLVLFCKGEEQDYIYRIHKDGNSLVGKRLFVGNLNFNLDYPIEAISDYESESIQKVYWVDGLNPNRVINIASSILYTGETSQFDFVPTIEKFPTIEVEKFFGGSGQFKSGVIQYYATYYNKFGSESAIVSVTPLNYISLEDRGGKEDEIINVNFKLTIKNIDKSFQYIRIYSAKRTSVDGPIEASIVGDYQIGDNDEIVLIDTNNNQQNIDPSLFYYISGDLFTATTLEKKDGVLFLGNINITDNDLNSDEKNRVSLYLKSHKTATITREYNKASVIRINPDESPTRCGNYGGDLAFYIRFDKPVASDVSIRIFYKMIYNTGSSWETAGPLNTIVYIKKGQQQIKIGVLGITEVDDSDYFVTNGSYILMVSGYDTTPYEDKPELYIHRPEDASYGGVTCIGYDDSYIYYTDSDSGAQVSTEETKTEEQMSNDIWECAAITFDYKEVPSEGNTDSYDYKSQLSETSKSIKSFKRGEIYRFAIQFQTNKGNWTNPVWIGDKKCNIAPKHDGGIVSVPTAKFEWTQEAREQLSDILEKFVNYRILIAETSESTRSIVAQGMVCPTMFNYGQRTDGTVFSFASYITRPMLSSVHNEHLDGTGANSESNAEIQNLNSGRPPCLEPNGIVVDGNIETADTYIIDFSYRLRSNDFAYIFNGEYYKVFVSIAPVYKSGDDYITNNAFIKQKYFSGTSYKPARRNLYDTVRAWIYDKTKLELDNDLGITFDENPYVIFSGFNSWTRVNNKEELKLYDNIDRNPETQLDGNWAWSTINNFEKIYDKGGSQISTQDITKRHGCYIDTSLVTLHSPELYYNKSSILDNTKFRIVGIAPINSIQYDSLIEATTGLSNYAGALSYSGNGKKPLINGYLYSEDVVNWKKDVNKKLQNVLFKMYMWHKQGSIIGQTALLDGQTEYYSVLKHKIFSNFGYSNKTVYNEDISENLGKFNESSASLFDSEENTLLKIKSSFGDIYYCGNYDNLLYAGTDSKYSLDYSKQEGENIALDAYTDPVRIKFKSTPHAIISLGSEDKTEVPILSAMNDYHKWSFTKIYGEDFDYLKSPSFDWGVQGISDNTFNKTVLGIYEIHNTSDETIDYFAQQAINELSPSILINGAAILSLLNSGIFVCVVTFKEGPNHIAVVDKVTKDFPLLIKATYETRTITGYTNYLDGRGDIYLSQNRYYLSVPEIRTYTQNILSFDEEPDIAGYVYIGELFRDIEYNTLYGGIEDFALQSLNWIPVSDGTPIDDNISLMEGDTYYQRFDCLKTYPWTEEDENSVVDVTSFMVETHINLDGRSDINRKGNILNIRPTNFNLRNPVYDQTNNIFVYNILDERFDEDSFKNQIVWSLTKTPTSIIDTWTKLNLANTLNLDANFGNLTKIIKNNDTLLAFQERGISAINFNNKVQISTEQGVPIELANSGKVDGYGIVTSNYGCLNKFTICKSKNGLYFIDSNKKLLVSISGEGIKEVSTVGGMSVWFKEKIDTNVWSPNNTASPVTRYDENTNDLYVSNNEWCLVYNEYLQTFTSFMEDYVNVDFGVNLNDKFYYLEHEGTLLNEMFAGDYVKDYSITYRVNAEPYIDKTFTNIEYIADVFDGKTIEPDIIPTNGLMQPFTELKVWNEHQEGTSNLEESKKLSNNIQKKRVWRDFIPRDKNNVRHRIKNPWIFLKLSRTGNTSIKTIFHNLIVKYFK